MDSCSIALGSVLDGSATVIVYVEEKSYSVIDLLPVTELKVRDSLIVAQPDDTFNTIDLLLVTDLELKPAANGSRKKRKA